MNQLNQQSSGLDLYNPLNSLFGEYSSIVGRVNSVAVLPAIYKNKPIVEGMTHEYSEVLNNEFQECSVNVVILRLS